MPIPACHILVESRVRRKCLLRYLIVDHLLVRIILLQCCEEFDNVGILRDMKSAEESWILLALTSLSNLRANEMRVASDSGSLSLTDLQCHRSTGQVCDHHELEGSREEPQSASEDC